MTCGSAVAHNGRSVATAIARRDLTAREMEEAVPWDDSIHERFFMQSRVQAQQQREADRQRWWAEYDEYLHSPEWWELRERVITRAGGRCEGCGKWQAQHVHHLTYAHRGCEFLFELVALCRDCHDRVHGRGRYAA